MLRGTRVEEKALVVALNAVVFLCSMRVSWAYGSWFWRRHHRLASQRLGLLPLSVFWLSTAVALEALYYGTARVAMHVFNVNMWAWSWPVNIIRMALITGALVHMIPYWKTTGRTCLSCWVGVDAAVYVAAFIGITWLFW